MTTLTTRPDQVTSTAMAISPTVPARLVQTGEDLWRVVDVGGLVLGHVLVIDDGAGIRYRARRFHAVSRTFRDLGDFWSCADAVDCVRTSR
ncbi:hypothetical protein ACFM35_05230 [Microbacterium sp. P01]|uniref:hypothetical protein n=1 Tax=unclassified Microbacterium TaxID=2609290 RepID=UPI00366AA0B4